MNEEICLNPAFADDDSISIEDLINQEYAKGYEQGKADEIEKFRKFSYCKVCEEKGWNIYCDYCRVCQAQEYIAEQLKEQKNDTCL